MAARILVVEDHTSVRTLLRVMLEAEGYRVMEAADGPQALDLASSDDLDLMILDLMMPELDGERVLAQLSSQEETKGLPIIVVSAKEEALDRVKDSIGAENVFAKPFEEQILLARIAELVGPGDISSSSPWKGDPRR
jgi:DNA-binding response OmpR family regulator